MPFYLPLGESRGRLGVANLKAANHHWHWHRQAPGPGQGPGPMWQSNLRCYRHTVTVLALRPGCHSAQAGEWRFEDPAGVRSH